MPQIATLPELNLMVILPELVLVFVALLVMLADMFAPKEQNGVRGLIPWLALIGVGLTAGVSIWLWDQPVATFQNMAILDQFALAVNLIILIAAGLGILLSIEYIPRITTQTGEYYTLLLLATAGMMMMGSVNDLITLFIAVEIFSLALYILCGMHRSNPRSTEASMKYFLLGAFASAFLVYGAALIYGATGSTQYGAIAALLASGQGNLYLLYTG
ncbi:MAG: proton-conducting transporter membrane subunit, partial [Litorilinea sp.]